MSSAIITAALIQLVVLFAINAHVLWNCYKKNMVLKRPVVVCVLVFCILHSFLYFVLGYHLGANSLYILASAYLMSFGVVGNTLRYARD